MAAPKGTRPPNAGKGRKAGTPNKATAAARDVFQALIDANADKLQIALDDVYKKDKERWFNMVMSLSEFVVPKLARTELSGSDGSGKVSVEVTFVDPPKPNRDKPGH